MTRQELRAVRSHEEQLESLLRLHPIIQVKKSGLLFAGNPSLRSWENIGQQIISVMESSTWWIADWLAFGEVAFQDRYLEAIKNTHLNYQTLRNYVWVARRFEFSRRRDTLSFGHHAEVAALDPPEQDYWLRKAEELGWSRNQMRHEVRTSLRERSLAPPPHAPDGAESTAACPHTAGLRNVSETLRLCVTQEQLELFKAAAGGRNQRLQEWVVEVLENEARHGCVP